MKPSTIRIEQCEAAREIEHEFGTQRALVYLIGEKFLNFLDAAETDTDFRSKIPAFVGEIKTIFEKWPAEYLERARQTEPFDPSAYEDQVEQVVEMEKRLDLRRSGWKIDGKTDDLSALPETQHEDQGWSPGHGAAPRQPVCGLVGSPLRRESHAVRHFEQHEVALLVRHVRQEIHE